MESHRTPDGRAATPTVLLLNERFGFHAVDTLIITIIVFLIALVSVAVVLVGAEELEWVEVVLTWDAELAEVTEAKPGSLLTLDGAPVAAARTLESGRARVRFTRSTGTSGSGAVAALTVRGRRPGSGSLTLESVEVGKPGATVPLAPPAPGRIVVAE